MLISFTISMFYACTLMEELIKFVCDKVLSVWCVVEKWMMWFWGWGTDGVVFLVSLLCSNLFSLFFLLLSWCDVWPVNEYLMGCMFLNLYVIILSKYLHIYLGNFENYSFGQFFDTIHLFSFSGTCCLLSWRCQVFIFYWSEEGRFYYWFVTVSLIRIEASKLTPND